MWGSRVLLAGSFLQTLVALQQKRGPAVMWRGCAMSCQGLLDAMGSLPCNMPALPCHALMLARHLPPPISWPTQVVREMLPLLEEVVAADYPLWRPAGTAVGAARPDSMAAASTGTASGPASMQTMGQGGVSWVGGEKAA